MERHKEKTRQRANRWDSIRPASLPRIKAREGIENVSMHKFYCRDELVRGCKSSRKMPRIIQSRVGNKGLSEEFSFRGKKTQL